MEFRLRWVDATVERQRFFGCALGFQLARSVSASAGELAIRSPVHKEGLVGDHGQSKALGHLNGWVRIGLS